jgi:DNA-binding MarR family transcriptional regulator
MPRKARGFSKVAQALMALRAFGADVERLDSVTAARVGLNRTDMRVMEMLNRQGVMSASELADATDLTTAAVTTVIDRLEGRGLATRTYDASDRRRVLVKPSALAAELSAELFAELLSSMQAFLAAYSDPELDTIVSFVTGARAVVGEQIAALRRLPNVRRSSSARRQ